MCDDKHASAAPKVAAFEEEGSHVASLFQKARTVSEKTVSEKIVSVVRPGPARRGQRWPTVRRDGG